MKKNLKEKIRQTKMEMAEILQIINEKWDAMLYSIYRSLAIKLQEDQKALSLLS